MNIPLQPFNFSGISARGIEVWRGERQVLVDVSLVVSAGECVHVLGPNGSGKTTLLRVIAGLLMPEQGTIEWGGRATAERRDDWCAAISYLAHNDALKPELSARENLAFDAGLRRKLRDGEIDTALADIGLSHAHDQPAGILSAGQRRRLAMARVTLAAAPFWILDEPYTNLDSAGAALVAALIGRHLDAGGAAIVAAHQPPTIPHHVPRRVDLAS